MTYNLSCKHENISKYTYKKLLNYDIRQISNQLHLFQRNSENSRTMR